MIILTVAALAAAQPAPAPAPQAPVGRPAGNGQMQQGANCPCCNHREANHDRDCCAGHAQHRGHDDHR